MADIHKAIGSTAGQSGIITLDQIDDLPHVNAMEKVKLYTQLDALYQILESPDVNNSYCRAHNKIIDITKTVHHNLKIWEAKQQPQPKVHQSCQTDQEEFADTSTLTVLATGMARQIGSDFEAVLKNVQVAEDVRQLVARQAFRSPPSLHPSSPEAKQWLMNFEFRLAQALQLHKTLSSKFDTVERILQTAKLSGSERANYNKQRQNHKTNIDECGLFVVKLKEQQLAFLEEHIKLKTPGLGLPVTAPIMSKSQIGAGERKSERVLPEASAKGEELDKYPESSTSDEGIATQTAVHCSAGGTQFASDNATAPLDPYAGSVQQQISYPAPDLQAAHPTQIHAHPIVTQSGPADAPAATEPTSGIASTAPVPQTLPALSSNFGATLPPVRDLAETTSFPGYVLEENKTGSVLTKEKLRELAREVMGTDAKLTPESEDIFIDVADDFVDTLIKKSLKLTKLRNGSELDVRDIAVVLERDYNTRIPGFSTDELRVIRSRQPAQGWYEKTAAVEAAKAANREKGGGK